LLIDVKENNSWQIVGFTVEKILAPDASSIFTHNEVICKNKKTLL
jgi:hypothetical protein